MLVLAAEEAVICVECSSTGVCTANYYAQTTDVSSTFTFDIVRKRQWELHPTTQLIGIELVEDTTTGELYPTVLSIATAPHGELQHRMTAACFSRHGGDTVVIKVSCFVQIKPCVTLLAPGPAIIWLDSATADIHIATNMSTGQTTSAIRILNVDTLKVENILSCIASVGNIPAMVVVTGTEISKSAVKKYNLPHALVSRELCQTVQIPSSTQKTVWSKKTKRETSNGDLRNVHRNLIPTDYQHLCCCCDVVGDLAPTIIIGTIMCQVVLLDLSGRVLKCLTTSFEPTSFHTIRISSSSSSSSSPSPVMLVLMKGKTGRSCSVLDMSSETVLQKLTNDDDDDDCEFVVGSLSNSVDDCVFSVGNPHKDVGKVKISVVAVKDPRRRYRRNNINNNNNNDEDNNSNTTNTNNNNTTTTNNTNTTNDDDNNHNDDTVDMRSRAISFAASLLEARVLNETVKLESVHRETRRKRVMIIEAEKRLLAKTNTKANTPGSYLSSITLQPLWLFETTPVTPSCSAIRSGEEDVLLKIIGNITHSMVATLITINIHVRNIGDTVCTPSISLVSSASRTHSVTHSQTDVHLEPGCEARLSATMELMGACDTQALESRIDVILVRGNTPSMSSSSSSLSPSSTSSSSLSSSSWAVVGTIHPSLDDLIYQHRHGSTLSSPPKVSSSSSSSASSSSSSSSRTLLPQPTTTLLPTPSSSHCAFEASFNVYAALTNIIEALVSAVTMLGFKRAQDCASDNNNNNNNNTNEFRLSTFAGLQGMVIRFGASGGATVLRCLCASVQQLQFFFTCFARCVPDDIVVAINKGDICQGIKELETRIARLETLIAASKTCALTPDKVLRSFEERT